MSFCKEILMMLSITVFFGQEIFAQKVDLGNYQYFGGSIGYSKADTMSGMAFQVVSNGAFYDGLFVEGSSTKLGHCNEESAITKWILLDLLTIDIGIGGSIGNAVYIGFSPFSVNLTQAPGFGLSVLSKIRIKDFVIEGKILPIKYSKHSEYKMLTNNSYVGLNYWLTERFTLGVRYNRYDKYRSAVLSFSWRLTEKE